ncbi:MarR family winged helix-turn-helix transcriptional regulator [Lachnospiraceae bacterium SGI.085]
MKDKNWIEIVKKQTELRHFGSMAIRKAQKGEHISAQEIDLLFRAACAREAVTPGQLAVAMGVRKTVISRLVEHLAAKQYIEKEPVKTDKRSYKLRVTDEGKKEIDRMYYYYLNPLYVLKEGMGEDRFEELFELIFEANQILAEEQTKEKE